MKFECSLQNSSLKERDSGISDAGRRRDREATQKEVDKLRESIQTLTRSANPLGKLMDFLQEDVDAMQRELDTWKQVRPFSQNWNQSYTQKAHFIPMRLHDSRVSHKGCVIIASGCTLPSTFY